MYLINNNALKIGDRLVMANNPFIIELDVSGTSFPSTTNSSQIRFNNIGLNELYIDWNDGTQIETILMNNSYFNGFSVIMHYYQDLLNSAKIGTVDDSYVQRRLIRIWFKFPENITGISLVNTTLYGKFPIVIGNYNLSTQLGLSTVRFLDTFPVSFKGLNTGLLALTSLTQNTITSLPEWIYNSRILQLKLVTGFSFSGLPSVTNLDKLINIIGLERLSLNGLASTSIPSNWKDVLTLRRLGVGGGTFTVLPDNIALISQLTLLTISDSDGAGYNVNFTSWGNGVGLMTNLNDLIYFGCTGNLLTTALPTGIINCTKIKNIRCGGSFTNLSRIEAHITNYYNMVVANGDIIITSNNKFRNVNFNIYFTTATSFRPTGTYQQPTGFVLGSNNGTPDSVMEMIWVLVNQYKWTITIMNTAGNGSQILS